MIMLLLLAAVAAGAYWVGKQSRPYSRTDATRPPAARTATHDEIPDDTATPMWPWVLGAVILGVLVLGLVSGSPGMFGGPGLFGGPGGIFAGLMGP